MLVNQPDERWGTADIPLDLIRIETGDGYIKIAIKDILPKANIKDNTYKNHWHSIMHKALKDVNITFEKAICVITVYTTAYYWDVDNRVYKYIIDSLRLNQIIPNDKHDNLSFMVMGGIDRENPRTEILLVKHPENIQEMLINSL